MGFALEQRDEGVVGVVDVFDPLNLGLLDGVVCSRFFLLEDLSFQRNFSVRNGLVCWLALLVFILFEEIYLLVHTLQEVIACLLNKL